LILFKGILAMIDRLNTENVGLQVFSFQSLACDRVSGGAGWGTGRT
jgi:hypothetical protein